VIEIAVVHLHAQDLPPPPKTIQRETDRPDLTAGVGSQRESGWKPGTNAVKSDRQSPDVYLHEESVMSRSQLIGASLVLALLAPTGRGVVRAIGEQ
jgi:hypothetical protein